MFELRSHDKHFDYVFVAVVGANAFFAQGSVKPFYVGIIGFQESFLSKVPLNEVTHCIIASVVTEILHRHYCGHSLRKYPSTYRSSVLVWGVRRARNRESSAWP